MLDLPKLPREALELIAKLQEQINYLRGDLDHANRMIRAMDSRLQEVDPSYHQTIKLLRTVDGQ